MSQTSITSWFKSATANSSKPTAESSQLPQITTPPPPPHITNLAPPPRSIQVPPPPRSPLAPPPRSPAAPPTPTTTTTTTEPSYFSQGTSSAPGLADSLKIHENVQLRPVTIDDITALRRILSLRLPVQYPDNFFKPITAARASRHSRLIVWIEPGKPDTIIGTLICRVENRLPQGISALYLQALCLLSPYQGLGLMSKAIDVAIASARDQDGVTIADAHVWTAQEDTVSWYKRRGFTRSPAPIERYYQKLQPPSAWILTRNADSVPRTPGILLSASSSSSSSSSSLSSSSLLLSSSAPTVGSSTLAAAANLPSFPASTSSSTTSLSSGAPPRGRLTGQSYQNAAPPTSWNDLPDDMAGLGTGTKPKASTATRKKRDRSYPAPTY